MGYRRASAIEDRWERAALVACVVAAWLALAPASAGAADPATQLSDAESRAASAEADVAAVRERVGTARNEYAAASRRAGPPAEAARGARAAARDLRARLAARQQRARSELSALEAAHRRQVEDHDQEVAFGIGFGLAALVAAGMALAWGRFRASGAVTTLGGIERGKALALCLSGGFLLVAVGAALSGGGGFVGAVGALFLGLGIALPAGLLLARHSTEIERGRAKPILGRERFPSWALRSAAALLLVISLTSLGAGLFAERPAGMEVSPQLREDATALTSDAGRRQLRQAATEEKAARTRAAGPLARQRATRVALRQATRRLRAAGRRLASAEADESRFARRVAVQVKREEREAAEAEERAQQEAEEQAEEAEEEPSGCDPNYSPCVPSYPPDVDCAEVGGPVSVTGSDPHGLDADNDGVGCE